MKRKVVVSILAASAGVLAAVSCGDDPAPTAPSLVPAPGAPPAAAAGGGSPAAPPARPADLRPAARADVRGLQPGQGTHGDFNAYDFEASWDGSMLHLALIEDEMRSMRESSKPHRSRPITVGTCPVEPHHATQSCGAPIWRGTRVLKGRLGLPLIPLAECAGWIVVNAAELSDDRYDGWRNAPCPDPDDETGVGSDGSGEGWPEYPEPEPERSAQSIADGAIRRAGGLVAGGGPVDVAEVSALFPGTGSTDGGDYGATSSAPAVATVEITSNPRVRVTPVGAGTATITVVFRRSGASVEFDVTVAPPLLVPVQVTETLDVPHSANNRVRTPFSTQVGRPPLNNVPQAQGVARTEYNNLPPAMFNPSTWTAEQIAAAWQALADTAAATHCTGEGYERAASVTTGTDQWEYSPNQNSYANTYQYYARKARTWAATCERTVTVYR